MGSTSDDPSRLSLFVKREPFPRHLTAIVDQVKNADSEHLGCDVDETSFDEMNLVR
jgi:hypothetical protein